MTLHATERSQDGDTYVYDLDVRDPAGTLVERWEGLRLRAVRKQDGTGPWLAACSAPTWNGAPSSTAGRPPAVRRATRRLPAPRPAQADRREQTARALRLGAGRAITVRYRPDGKPEVDGGIEVSSSHGAGVDLRGGRRRRPSAATSRWSRSRSAAGVGRSARRGRFALARLLAAERGEELSLAATRVWGALECLRKAGLAIAGLAGRPTRTGWVVLRLRAPRRIATFPTTVRVPGRPCGRSRC